MAAKIGILGETQVVTGGTTTTVYTVPASKAARIRILFAVEGGAGTWELSVQIGAPGTDRVIVRSVASGNDCYTGITGAGSLQSNTVGIVEGASILNLDDTDTEQIILPYPHDYFLSTGDTVKFRVGTTTGVDGLFQVIGVEDDA